MSLDQITSAILREGHNRCVFAPYKLKANLVRRLSSLNRLVFWTYLKELSVLNQQHALLFSKVVKAIEAGGKVDHFEEEYCLVIV